MEQELHAKNLNVLVPSDWLILSDYITVTKPVAEGLDILQGDKHACLGYLLPTLFAIKKRISSSMLNTAHGESMRDVLIQSIETRFGSMMETTNQNRELYLASVTHPLFKMEWIPQEKHEIVKQWFVETIRINYNDSDNQQQQSETDFFYRYSSNNAPQNVEIEQYLSHSVKEVTMLNNFPIIKKLFIDYNTTLSSTGVIERMFSNATLVFQPRRNRLTSVNFERAMCLKKNRSVISELKNCIIE